MSSNVVVVVELLVVEVAEPVAVVLVEVIGSVDEVLFVSLFADEPTGRSNKIAGLADEVLHVRPLMDE